MTSLLRREVIDAARELEELGEHERAAEAYARVGDRDGQARALALAGSIDKLDALLSEEQSDERRARARQDAHDRLASMVALGQRREAAGLARSSEDELLRERGRTLEARRPAASAVRLGVAGLRFTLTLGDEIVIGRAPETRGVLQGAIAVPSVALSRSHLLLARRGRDVVVRDLGSRNGTFVRGLRLDAELSVGDGLDLQLAGEVPLSVRPTGDLPGALAIEVAGTRNVAPLGVASVGVGAWRIERGPDGWVELVTGDAPPAFAGRLELAPRVSLVVGDSLASERGGPPVVIVEG